MKRFHPASLLLAVLAGIASAGEPLPEAGASGTILEAQKPITVDGVLDEPCWKRAAPVRMDYVNGKQGVLSAEPRALAKFAWDERFLYIAYETFDRNLVTLSSGRTEGPPDNLREGCEIWHPDHKIDVIEFFLSFGSHRFFWEVHHNAANQFNDVWCTVADESWPLSESSMLTHGILFGFEMWLKDDGPHRLATAVRLKPRADGAPSTINDPADTDTGYTAELRLPWLGIGAPAKRHTWIVREPAEPGGPRTQESGPWKMAGQQILIIAVVQDGDLSDRYHHSSPTRTGGWFHKSVPDWPRYTLSSGPTP